MFANSKGQLLSQHSYAVGCLALHLFDALRIPSKTTTTLGFDGIENFRRQIFLSGVLHDIGKIDSAFQSFLNNKSVSDFEPGNPGVHIKTKSEKDKFSFLQYPRHKEVSWAIFKSAIDFNISLKTIEPDIAYTLYYHHENILRDCVWGSSAILSRVHEQNGVDFSNTPDTIIEQIKIFVSEIWKTVLLQKKCTNKCCPMTQHLHYFYLIQYVQKILKSRPCKILKLTKNPKEC